MYDIDFLAVENEDHDGAKSGDAIVINVPDANTGAQRLIIIDAGFIATGDQIVKRVRDWYKSDHVDLVISTHPDSDHLNGIQTVIEALDVDELMLHLPWSHNDAADELGNFENVRDLHAAAIRRGVTVTEPFTGVERFGGAVRVLGPTKAFYNEQLHEAVVEAQTGVAASRYRSAGSVLLAAGGRVLKKALGAFPFETLTNSDDTGPRNQMSVVTLVRGDNLKMLFTGDAGISALEAAADDYETSVGIFSSMPLDFFQAPHHGSQRNLGPDILDRIIGPRGNPHALITSFISSAKASEKHPSAKVTNALGRREVKVMATEGQNIHKGTGERPGYTRLEPLPPLEEDDA